MKDGGPAFGGAYDQVFGEDNGKGPLHKIEARVAGMSLRDYFAAAALTGLVAEFGVSAEGRAMRSYEYADAMIKVREKT